MLEKYLLDIHGQLLHDMDETAEFEGALIQERVRVGLRNARAKGKQHGRPQRTAYSSSILRLKAEGVSLRQIAERLGIDYWTVRARLQAS